MAGHQSRGTQEKCLHSQFMEQRISKNTVSKFLVMYGPQWSTKASLSLKGCILLFVILIGCTNGEEANVSGHWHLYANTGDLRTLDIEDSICVLNKYDATGVNYLEVSRYDSNGKQILPLQDIQMTGNYYLSGDTLVIEEDSLIAKYVRSNPIDCAIRDTYSQISVNVSPPMKEHASKLETPRMQLCEVDIFIGKLKGGSSSGNALLEQFPDSIFMQVRDQWIEFNELGDLIRYFEIGCEADSVFVYTHCDKSIPSSFINKFRACLPESTKALRVVQLNETELGTVRIQ